MLYTLAWMYSQSGNMIQGKILKTKGTNLSIKTKGTERGLAVLKRGKVILFCMSFRILDPVYQPSLSGSFTCNSI